MGSKIRPTPAGQCLEAMRHEVLFYLCNYVPTGIFCVPLGTLSPVLKRSHRHFAQLSALAIMSACNVWSRFFYVSHELALNGLWILTSYFCLPSLGFFCFVLTYIFSAIVGMVFLIYCSYHPL